MEENEEKYNKTVSDMPWLFYDFKEFVKYQEYYEYKKHIHLQLIYRHTMFTYLKPNNVQLITNQERGTVEKEGQRAFDKQLTQMSLK
ncbi:unnamed protein product [Paramecium octaurelia]|uniref:Uncharacterized protein n=1 Tax=Paramecium octaurelia TaxID=43137 RepID=A0A8S1XBV1_PAROT|nr:unnamed protein product [Paramecium octaurelia]